MADDDADVTFPLPRRICPRCGKRVNMYHDAGVSLSCVVPSTERKGDVIWTPRMFNHVRRDR